MRWAKRLVFVALATTGALVGCAHGPHAASAAEPTWEYLLDVPAPPSRALALEATFTSAGATRLTLADEANPHVHDLALRVGDRWEKVEAVQGGWDVPSCASRCTVRYTLDLGELATTCGDDPDCSRRVGRSTISPAYVWLLRPEPHAEGTATLRVRGGD